MKILMFHPHDIYSSLEPWTVRIVAVAGEFVQKGHQVKLVYFPLDWEKRPAAEERGGITFIPFPRMHGTLVLFSNILKAYRLAGWADIVHFQKCFYHAAFPAALAAVLRAKPLHYDWDDWEAEIYQASAAPGKSKGFFRGFIALLENMLPGICDTVSVASKRLKAEALRLGVAEEVIFDAHVGADLARFRPEVSGEAVRKTYGLGVKPLVLYLGQLHGGQYVELFIETAAKLTYDYRKELMFMIVGDGYQAQALKDLAAQRKLGSRLIFSGAVPHEAVPNYVAAADVCVACFEENAVTACKSPLKVAEYLAAGKAIVASAVGEVPAMLGNAGILVKPGDSAALAEGILKVVDNPGLKSDLEKKARLRAEAEYNWPVTAENLLRAYEKSLPCT